MEVKMETNTCTNRRRPTLHVLKIVGWVILGIIGASLLALLFGYIVMWLWNWLMPELFGLGIINFWKAVGIVILAKIVFGGIHPHHKDHDSHPSFFRYWKKKYSNKKSNGRSWHKWHYYDQFWKDEGESAFDDYVEKRRKNNTEE